jgi:hypothetical protein
MASSKKSRFTLTGDAVEKERQSIQALVEEYEPCPLEDEDLTGDASKRRRLDVMEEWKT